MRTHPKIGGLGAGLLILSLNTFGQRLSIGVVGGLSLTDDYHVTGTTSFLINNSDLNTTFTNVNTTGSHHFVIGPKLELNLTEHFSFEVDALHRNREWTDHYSYSPPINIGYGPVSSDVYRMAESTWEVPLLVKYRLPAFRSDTFGSAFVEAGPSLRPWLYYGGGEREGFTAGAGFQVRRGGLNIEPMIRYTHWGAGQLLYRQARPNPDQLEFLIGVRGGSTSVRPSAFGRKLTVGALGGFDLTGAFPAKGGYASVRSKFVGVLAESGLSKSLSLEVDALYHPLSLSEMQHATVLTWEFPVLVKYRFPARGVAPFVELGPSFRSTGNLSGTNPSHYGVTAGAGVETRQRWLAISPAIRFTRWRADPMGVINGPDTFTIRNQAELLVGFSF